MVFSQNFFAKLRAAADFGIDRRSLNLFFARQPILGAYKSFKKEDIMARIVDGERKNMIGTNLRRMRKMRGLSQQEISDRLELMGVYVCRGSVSRIEDYTRSVTDIELYAFAEVLGVKVDELFEN